MPHPTTRTPSVSSLLVMHIVWHSRYKSSRNLVPSLRIAGSNNIDAPGVLLSMTNPNGLALKDNKSVVSVGAGLRWAQVYDYLSEVALVVVDGGASEKLEFPVSFSVVGYLSTRVNMGLLPTTQESMR